MRKLSYSAKTHSAFGLAPKQRRSQAPSPAIPLLASRAVLSGRSRSKKITAGHQNASAVPHRSAPPSPASAFPCPRVPLSAHSPVRALPCFAALFTRLSRAAARARPLNGSYRRADKVTGVGVHDYIHRSTRFDMERCDRYSLAVAAEAGEPRGQSAPPSKVVDGQTCLFTPSKDVHVRN